MIAYLDQSRNSDNTNLPPECPWTSWVHNDGQPLPENTIILSDEDYAILYASYEPLILKEKDRIAMEKRAQIKDALIGEIASENKERLRTGVWSYTDLVTFLNSEESKKVMNEINGLSFELAQGSIMAIVNPIITMDIKLQWVQRLKENLFL
jgi:hypothetical protein